MRRALLPRSDRRPRARSLALVALLAYGLAAERAGSRPRRRPRARRARAGARRSSCRGSTEAAASVARGLPRPGRGAQLLGLVVRALPGGVAAARALARSGSSARRHGARRRHARRDRRRRRLHRASTSSRYPMLQDKDGEAASSLRRGRVPRDVRDRPPAAASPRSGAGPSTRSSCAPRSSRCWRAS